MSEEAKIGSPSTVSVTLEFSDRLSILDFLPSEGNIMTMSIAKDIKKKTVLTTAELQGAGAIQNGNTIHWDQEKAKEYSLTIQLTKPELKVIQDKIKKLDSDNKISMEIVSLAEKLQELKVD